ncbi:MAG: DUF1700 domain-containing protein [Ruminococcaceae bacterium]|nr:DUF1700 domain-containing protein [Oscillospiraceae bacterium]
MTKLKFILALHDKLSALPKDEVEERLNFYSEMIEDRMEEGLCEEEAVAAIGSVDEIAEQIKAEIRLAQKGLEAPKSKRRLRTWEIVLLVLGAPFWAPLLIVAFAILFSQLAALWAVIVSIWAGFISLAACTLSVLYGLALVIIGQAGVGLAAIGAGLFCAGLAIFAFFGCLAATKAVLWLTRSLPRWIKKCFPKKEVAE